MGDAEDETPVIPNLDICPTSPGDDGCGSVESPTVEAGLIKQHLFGGIWLTKHVFGLFSTPAGH